MIHDTGENTAKDARTWRLESKDDSVSDGDLIVEINSQDLINLLFSHPYSKIEPVEKTLEITRKTAAHSLNLLTAGGFLQKHKTGRDNYYINIALFQILISEAVLTNENR